MLLIEKIMAAFANFLACTVMTLDSRDIERARDSYLGRASAPPVVPSDRSQVIVRFGR